MISTATSEAFSDQDDSATRPIGVHGAAVAVALLASGVLAAICIPFAVVDGEDLPLFAAIAVLASGCGFWNLRRPFSTSRIRAVPAMSAVISGVLVVAAISMVVYLVSGELTRADDAAYESITGVATSALTIFDDPSRLSEAMLVWRSGTQWLGGLAGLGAAVAVLPFLGGSRELAGGPQRRKAASARFATRPLQAMKRLVSIYAIVTVAVALAFLAVGMGVRDAVAHSLSTVSTGGFSTHAESFGHFDSVAVELVAIVAMLGAGSSVAFAWLLWRRAFGDTRRAFELQVYLFVLLVATTWIWWLRRSPDLSASRGVRESLFTVTSAMTTTGHRLDDWGQWHPGASALLLVLLVVGGTAGSVSGGLRWIRVVGMGQFVWRELQRQLHPRSVRTVKVGRTTISEASVDRMHAQMVYVLTLGAVASLVLALFGEGITQAITLTISAISTMGPGFDDVAGVHSAADLSRPERAVLMPVMLTGRMFLYPAFAVVGSGVSFLVSRVVRVVGR